MHILKAMAWGVLALGLFLFLIPPLSERVTPTPMARPQMLIYDWGPLCAYTYGTSIALMPKADVGLPADGTCPGLAATPDSK